MMENKLDRLHFEARRLKWLGHFTIFFRIALAYAFIFSGYVKVSGERFTVLTVFHPMGHYLDAFYRTGYYYTFVGIMQMLAGLLLLIPRTATLGAFIYFPIILNICVLSIAVRFEGSLLSSPLMVLAVLYLICWDYHKWKFILPFNHSQAKESLPAGGEMSSKFPFRFFAGVGTIMVLVAFFAMRGFEIVPRVHLRDCKDQCTDSERPEACLDFCNCIYLEGQSLDSCLAVYNQN